jgi:DNA processing protein
VAVRLESTESCRARLKLALAAGIPRNKLISLLKHAGTPEKLFWPNKQGLAVSSPTGETSLFQRELRGPVEEQLGLGARIDSEVLAWCDPEYPPLLKHIQSPPVVLFVRGNSSILSRPAVAVVGSRRCSHSGRHVAEKLGRELAGAGLVVVSGLARGIDSAAHRGAISVEGATVAVLGCGVDVCYPRENRRLMAEVEARGAVVSEFVFGTRPLKQNFPMRNRLISGLSLGVLVVEAGNESGALVTAGHALEQGREVFSVPGDITLSSTVGSNRLLKEGAKPVTCLEDVMEELDAEVVSGLVPVPEREAPACALSKEEQAVLALLSPNPLHVNVLCEQLGRDAASLLPVLLCLELKGLVKQEAGSCFRKCANS